MSLLTSTFRPCVLAAVGLAAFALAGAAPTTTSEDDAAAAASRSARSSGAGASEMPGGGDSRTMQMLLDLQSSRAPLEGGERARLAPSATAPPPPAVSRPAAPAPLAAPAAQAAPTPAQNPFARALELGKPAAARELRGPAVASTSSGDQNGRSGSAEAAAALRGDRPSDGASAEAEQLLRDKLGGQIPMPVALMRYIRENRTTVLMFSLASLALVGWVGARATQKRR